MNPLTAKLSLARRLAHVWSAESPKAATVRTTRYLTNIVGRRSTFDEVALIFKILTASRQIGTMIDVGAHHGNTMAPFLRAGWTIFAFEPDPFNRAELEAAYPNADNLHISDCAVAREDDLEVEFFTSKLSSGISGLVSFDSSHRASHSVRTVTLKSHLAEHEVTNVDLLKVDAEGLDLEVLQSLDWQQVLPRVVVAEFEDAKTKPLGHGWHDIARFLEERGYSIVVSEWEPIRRYGAEHNWSAARLWPCELSRSEAWGNLVAFQDEKLASLFLTMT